MLGRRFLFLDIAALQDDQTPASLLAMRTRLSPTALHGSAYGGAGATLRSRGRSTRGHRARTPARLAHQRGESAGKARAAREQCAVSARTAMRAWPGHGPQPGCTSRHARLWRPCWAAFRRGSLASGIQGAGNAALRGHTTRRSGGLTRRQRLNPVGRASTKDTHELGAAESSWKPPAQCASNATSGMLVHFLWGGRRSARWPHSARGCSHHRNNLKRVVTAGTLPRTSRGADNAAARPTHATVGAHHARHPSEPRGVMRCGAKAPDGAAQGPHGCPIRTYPARRMCSRTCAGAT